MYHLGWLLALVLATAGCRGPEPTEQSAAQPTRISVFSLEEEAYRMVEKIAKSEEEWRRQLSPEEYRIIRRKGTERPFANAYWDHHEHGVYRCRACGQDLFASGAKYESGTGWPSFTRPVAPENIRTAPDNSLFMRRTEVLCSRCDAHLGHLFPDGPPPSGQRYCLNSAALQFVPTD